ncbi:hypothetical protein K2173_010941 [Erythroxylum novogranatense]|uniref:non-specific serine/threonine protein kinase n=1 Tax=Erythroxylum novogranatense TaxID=1862640 RepID=A0AAV8T1E5_9ROSI|nr:hypothetical protein K2173_010941 [Erythroxylum novogranatense]
MFPENSDCCNSQNPKKLLLPITSANMFSQSCIDINYEEEAEEEDSENLFYRKLSYRTWSAEEQHGEKRIPYTPEKTLNCKKIPVEETSSARISRHSSGRKMINEYVKERKISRGSYGKVALYRSISSGTPYAIKAVCKSRLSKLRISSTESAMTNVLREVSILKTLEHENVVNLIEVIDDQRSDYLYMVLEYVGGSPISSIFETKPRIDDTTARRYFRDVVAGLVYLHSHNIVHGDIKPENLLLTTSGRVKIGDFSVSHTFENGKDELWQCPGTPAFTAPECCSGTAYSGKAADTWAAGVTLYFMLVGSCPFLGDSLPETYDKIVHSPLELPEDLDPELKDLVQSLLCKDPLQRISLNSVAEHPWMVKDDGPVPVRNLCSCG